ncbi:MAG: tetratricopeptide repeat protein [Acidimicrobiales bacterium]|nr:tetratricopeptide repeat protein [Acidimicrobiales bacterium]
MSIDVTDATFERDVLDRSVDVPVVVDLWAPWCGPCKVLGPILESAVGEQQGRVVLAKVNVDDNPQVAAAFQVQSIPAVYAVHDRKVVDGFIGAQGEPAVRDFIDGLLPTEEETEVTKLIRAGDEVSLRRALELDPDNEAAVVALAELLVAAGQGDEALQLLARVPESAETRRVAALARLGDEANGDPDDIESRLASLLDRVKGDEEARQEFVDLLEVMGSDDPRTMQYRKALTARLF